MKKSAAIITIYDENNYGNRLQNYAVQTILKKNNLNPTTIKSEYFPSHMKMIIWSFYKNIRKFLNIYIKKDFRMKNFQNFNKKYIQSNKRYYSTDTIPSLDYDYYVAGSDQIWNPKLSRMKELDLLIGFKKNKSFSFSASFGVSDLDDDKDISRLKKSMKEMKGISVREQSGSEIINKYCNIKAEVLLDPTMFITIDEWEKVEHRFDNLPNRYIVTYFLGEMNKQSKNLVERIAKELNCKIVNIMDINDIYYQAGPSEFLYIIHNSQFVITDSFHATVFSIIYQIPFYTIDRNYGNINMNSRVKNLLNIFDLEDRYIDDYSKYELRVDFLKTESILSREKTKMNNFLKSVLEE